MSTTVCFHNIVTDRVCYVDDMTILPSKGDCVLMTDLFDDQPDVRTHFEIRRITHTICGGEHPFIGVVIHVFPTDMSPEIEAYYK